MIIQWPRAVPFLENKASVLLAVVFSLLSCNLIMRSRKFSGNSNNIFIFRQIIRSGPQFINMADMILY